MIELIEGDWFVNKYLSFFFFPHSCFETDVNNLSLLPRVVLVLVKEKKKGNLFSHSKLFLQIAVQFLKQV